MSDEIDELEVRELLERGASGASDPDLVAGVWRSAGHRRRKRRLVAGSAVAAAAAAAVVVSQWGGVPEDLGPADHTAPSATESPPGLTQAEKQLEANQRFLEGIRGSGIDLDYEPMESPEWAISGGRQVLAGVVHAVRPSGDDFVVSVVVQQAIPEGEVGVFVDAVLRGGTLHDLTPEELGAVGGPVLLALPDRTAPDASTAEVWPYVDGFWLDVPGGIGNPYLRWTDMTPAWPNLESVEDLTAILTTASEEAPLEIECSASWQNPPSLYSKGLSAAALDTANELIRLAGNCDEEGLIAAAVANATTVAVSDGDIEEQLATPDDIGAYVRLEGTMGHPSTREGDLHVFELEGWRVVIHDDGRWVEFSRE